MSQWVEIGLKRAALAEANYSAGRHSVFVSTLLPVASTGSVVQTSFSAVSVCGVAQAEAAREKDSSKVRLYID